MLERSGANWLFGVALVVLLIPVWAFSFFPSQDGPAHVENARILVDYGRPDQPALRDFYKLSAEPVPNWFSHVVLAGFLRIGGPRLADRLFLSLCVLGLPFAFRYALTALRPDAGARVLLVAPFVYNHFLHLGYYNLAFSTVPFFMVLGFWLRHDDRPQVRTGVILSLLLLWLYFCHLVALVLALAALSVLATARAAWKRSVRSLLVLGAAALPSLALAASFLSTREPLSQESGPSAHVRLLELLRLNELVSYDIREAWASTALAVALLAIGAWLLFDKAIRRTFWHGDVLTLVVAVFTAVYFAARTTVLNNPTGSAGGGTTHDRVSLFVYLSLVMWIAVQPLSRRVERGLGILGLAAAICLVAVRLPRYAELDSYLTEYVSAGATVPRDAVLFPVNFAPEGLREDGTPLSARVLPFLHAASWIAAERGVVDLLNYEADLGYFPVRFRPKANPYRLMRRALETRPPCVSLNRYDRLGPRPMDFILLWGARQADHAHPCVRAILGHVEERYDLVFTSAPRGLASLYRRKAQWRPAVPGSSRQGSEERTPTYADAAPRSTRPPR
jgi:hypothetical protein